MIRLHGTAVAVGGQGVLLRGRPGSGKSSLALSLIDQPGFGTGGALLRATLISDDQVELTPATGELLLSPPARLAGLMEIRGLGIVRLPHVTGIALRLVIDLAPAEAIDRMPEPQDLATELAGRAIQRLTLDPFDLSAAARVRAGLTCSDMVL